MKRLKHIFFSLILSATGICAYGQVNLVPNPSFEIYDTCSNYFSTLYYATPWFQPCIGNGNTRNSCSSDLYDSCSAGETGVPLNDIGYQLARTGKAYGGIFCNADTTNYREYIEVPLLSPLIGGNPYCVEFYVSLADDESQEAISSIGAYFSSDSLLVFTSKAINYVIPQIENDTGNFLTSKTSWMKIFGVFTASGGEKFMTIGNFRTPANTAIHTVGGALSDVYYYIDDISVIDCDSLSGINDYNKPPSFTLSPNPNNGTMTLKYSVKPNDKASMKIYELTGKLISEYVLNANDSQFQIAANLDKGIYLYRIIVNESVVKSDKVIIIK